MVEPSEVLRASAPVARKEHRCDECRRIIEPDERYHFWACLEGGDFFTHKMCFHCRVSIQIGEQVSGCGSWYWTLVWDSDPETGFIANVLSDEHELGTHGKQLLKRLVKAAEQGWRTPEGNLMQVPRLKRGVA